MARGIIRGPEIQRAMLDDRDNDTAGLDPPDPDSV
jgi:hypothetical protein